jgi:hypothetical protein
VPDLGPQKPPSPTGVRIAGDHYQWMHVWRTCLQVLRDHEQLKPSSNPALAVGVELDNSGNVDDVVLFREAPPHDYSQVKYAVDASSPVGQEYLTSLVKSGSSLISKFASAHADFTARGESARLSLLTNRVPDHRSSLISGRDSRTGLLVPNAGLQGPRSARGRERAAWAQAAGLSEEGLLDLLAVIRFDLGWDPQMLHEHLCLLMAVTGLKADANALRVATAWVEERVIAGERRLDLGAIRSAVDTLALRAGRAWPTISIACLKPDPLAAEAVCALDWVDRFEGNDPFSKRRPAPPATWDALAADLDAVGRSLTGMDAALVTGSLRQATGFALGARLRKVAGFDVGVRQGPQIWRSDEPFESPTAPAEREISLGLGSDLAVVVDVATSATDDVVSYIREQSLPIDRVLTVSPAVGAPRDQALPDASAAIALAVGIRDTVRRGVRTGPTRVHLFLAGPLGLALLLGHRWNRICKTIVYEDLSHEGYQAAFTISA